MTYLRYRRRPGPIATETDLRQYVGQTGEIRYKDAWFSITVLDARVRFGTVDLLVTPVEGRGSFWTPRDHVRLDEHSKEA